MTDPHLITGAAGQDGVLLARLLRARAIPVVGTVTATGAGDLVGYLDAVGGVELVEHDVRDADAFDTLLHAYRPAVVHNLAAMSSVSASWDDPELARSVNGTAVEDMLAVLQRGHRSVRFVQASSSEIFGPAEGPGTVVGVSTPMQPVSPYAEAKAGAHDAVRRARDAGLAATNLILFGHTSVLQDTRFVLPTIARQAAEAGLGNRAEVILQNPAVRRDWGAASDVVAAFAAAATAPPLDAVVGTGTLHSLGEVVRWALAAAGADDVPPSRSGAARENDFDGLVADTSAAGTGLGWQPRTDLRDEIGRMVRVARRRIETGREHDPVYLDPAEVAR